MRCLICRRFAVLVSKKIELLPQCRQMLFQEPGQIAAIEIVGGVEFEAEDVHLGLFVVDATI
jgi:hypothetical protein